MSKLFKITGHIKESDYKEEVKQGLMGRYVVFCNELPITTQASTKEEIYINIFSAATAYMVAVEDKIPNVAIELHNKLTKHTNKHEYIKFTSKTEYEIVFSISDAARKGWEYMDEVTYRGKVRSGGGNTKTGRFNYIVETEDSDKKSVFCWMSEAEYKQYEVLFGKDIIVVGTRMPSKIIPLPKKLGGDVEYEQIKTISMVENNNIRS